MRSKIVISFLFVIITVNITKVYSQILFDTIADTDSLVFKQISIEKWILANSFESEENKSESEIYSLDNFQRYKLFGNDFPNINLGNVGSSSYSFNSFSDKLSSIFFLSSVENYKSSELSLFSVNRPFTSFQYTNGYKSEQTLSVFHTQNFSPTFNVGFKFDKTNSPGFYSGQKTDVTNIETSSHFWSRKKRYGLLFYFNLQRFRMQENGGISELNDFFENLIENKELVETKLDLGTNNSSSKNGKQNFTLVQQLQFLNKDDTISNSFYLFNFSHELNYKSASRKFEDSWPQGGFFNNIFIDSTNTNDSIFSNLLLNSFRINLNLSRKSSLFILGGYEYLKYFQNILIDTNFSNTFLQFGWNIFSKKYTYSFKGKYIFSGYNKGDIAIISELVSKGRIGVFYCNIDIRREEAPYFVKRQYSNHFIWEYKDFIKRDLFSGKIGYEIKKFSINPYLQGFRITNSLYFDTYAYPKQFLYDIYVLKTGVSAKFKFMKFNFYPNLFYQNISEKKILPMPDFVTSTSIFYSSKLFKSALELQIGADLFYYSSYFGNSYMPATGVFYLQNEIELGNYPYVDLFMNVKIKRAKFFIKYEHANAGLNGFNYMEVPYYPNGGRALRVGLWWGFLN